MDADFENFVSPIDIEALLEDAVANILGHEDPAQFMDWICRHFHQYDISPQQQFSADADMITAMAIAFGRAIWNAMPLPGNHYRPKAIPAPGRNERCLCGSGRKYKHCCGEIPPLPPMAEGAMWPLVLDRLPVKTANQLIATKRVPAEVLLEMAEGAWQAGQVKKAVKYLATLFDAPISQTDELHDYALNCLCNYYDDLGQTNKKRTLIKRIIDTVPRSPLRSGAWQRLATMRIDQGDVDGAWEAFQHAQRDDPNALGIAVLEVQLLVATNETERAQARAQFWVKHMERLGLEPDEYPLAFMQAIAQDPIQAMAAVGLDVADDAGSRLQSWLHEVESRPVPTYTVSDTIESHEEGTENPLDSIHTRRRQLGFAEDELSRELAQAELDLFDDNDSWDDSPDDQTSETLFLIPPPKLVALEAPWHDTFPLEKPFSIHDEVFDIDDVWEPMEEDAWMEILELHPQAFDSLDILDDLATALVLHEQFTSSWLDQLLLGPVLLRAEAIIQNALQAQDTPRLSWLYPQNRPALRCLSRLVGVHKRAYRIQDAMRVMKLLLQINPNDNHGFRSILMDELLRHGNDQEALALANNYPDDMHAELLYGRVLALYRLDERKEAHTVLIDAVERLPKIVRYLTHKRVRKPMLEPQGIQIGGDDQAWLYRDAMRDVWEATPGVLDWLKKSAKQIV